MVASSEHVKELISWLNSTQEGRCATTQVCSFYASHPHLNRRRLGSLKAICKKFKESIGYERIENECFLSTIGKLPLTFNVRWSDQACISASFVESVVDAEVNVNNVSSSSRGLDFYAFREKKKATSKENRDKLKVDQAAIDGLLASEDSLVSMAQRLNIAYVDFAIALLGWDFIDSERETILSSPPHLMDRKHKLLYEALNSAIQDTISGYKLNIKSEGEMRQHAVKGENVLEAELKTAMGLKAGVDYITEEDTKRALSEGDVIPLTPDVLFKTPQTILGKQCFWAEAKHSLVLPGVSPDRIIADIKRQTDKYVEAFGPGLILWTKCGFCDSIRAELSNEILHVVPISIGLKYRHLWSANPRAGYSSRNHYAQNNFFQRAPYAPSHSYGNSFFASMLGTDLGRNNPFSRQSMSRTWLLPGEFLGGEEGLDQATGRSRLLDRLTEEASAAQAAARAHAAHPHDRSSAEDDEDGFTAMLTRMFASPDDDVEQQLTKLNVYVKLLRLTDAGAKALSLVSKILQNILTNPGEEKYRSVKVVNTLSASPTALKLLSCLGFEKVVEEPRLKLEGEAYTAVWTSFLVELTHAEPAEGLKIVAPVMVAAEPECTGPSSVV